MHTSKAPAAGCGAAACHDSGGCFQACCPGGPSASRARSTEKTADVETLRAEIEELQAKTIDEEAGVNAELDKAIQEPMETQGQGQAGGALERQYIQEPMETQGQGQVDGALERQDTLARMEKKKAEKWALPICWLVAAIGCFWLPVCCFLAAANVLPSCETLDLGEDPLPLVKDQSMADFLKQYSLLCIITGPLVQTAVKLTAYLDDKDCFKHAEKLHGLSLCVLLGLYGHGWNFYANTTDENCYDGDGDPSLDHYINPRKMLLGILLAQTIPPVGLLFILCFLHALRGDSLERP